jgi:hypothetical protein
MWTSAIHPCFCSRTQLSSLEQVGLCILGPLAGFLGYTQVKKATARCIVGSYRQKI